MPDTWKDFTLRDGEGAAKGGNLSTFLTGSAGSSARLNAAGLRRLDTMVLQLILCAAAERARRQIGFELVDVPEPIDAQLCLLGVTQDILKRKVAA